MDELQFCSFPYPIADTEEHPRISYFQGVLNLVFVDYMAIRRHLRYDDVAYFALASIDADPRNLHDDQSYVVVNSSLIEKLAATRDIDDKTEFTHQIVCFNETGQFLEIVYRTLDPSLRIE